MLWQKEMIDGEMMYASLLTADVHSSFIDYFLNCLNRSTVIRKNILKKCDLIAQDHRKEGNDSYQNGNFQEAIRIYNIAISIAQNQSEELGICYANRSACFSKLKQYALCLADIKLAMKNHYPTRLLPKLERRRIECENLLAANTGVELQREKPKLSFEADHKIPCFASGLEVNYSKKYGNHIMTNRDLNIGQTVIVERAIVYQNSAIEYECQNCLKWATNPIPCDKCMPALFCSEECRVAGKVGFHSVVCGIDMICNGKIIYLLRSIFVAIKTFSTVEALIDAVEKFRSQDGHEIVFDDPAKRNYWFFSLHTQLQANADKLTAHEINTMKIEAVEAVEIWTCVSNVRESFQSIKVKRFLLHLALHHLHIIRFNACSASHGLSYRFGNFIGIEESEKGTALGHGVAPYSSQMNHSCVPNVCRIFIDDTVVYKVIRPIKSGEQLFISYL